MKFWNKFKRKCALEYISQITTNDKSKQEKNKWMILIYGNRVDDLVPGEGTSLIPFEETYYSKTKKEAEEAGKIAWDKGHHVELWELKKRWK